MQKLSLLLPILIILLWPSFAAKSAISFKGNGILTLLNTHTHEFETIKYRDGERYLKGGVEELNRILRCRFTNKKASMSLRLIELVDNIEDHFGVRDIEVISGYRSPELNSSLRAGGHRVASKSLHTAGLAMDIKMQDIPLEKIRDYARSLKIGGVGYYPGQFVHIDVGPVRYW